MRRPAAFSLALIALMLGLLAGPATAASSKPVVTLTGPVVSGTSVSIAVSVNRKSNQISSCTYVLDSASAISCGAKTAAGGSTRYTIALTGQTTGGHTIVVTIALTDGGRGNATTTFTIAAPARVFARAWTNVDDVPGYQAGGSDVLIMELEDTNRDNVVSVGDTVIADRFPLDFAASGFGTWGLRSQPVTDAVGNGGGTLSVGTATGFVAWEHDANLEGAAFHSGGGSLSPIIVDWYSATAQCTTGDPDTGDVDIIYADIAQPLNPSVNAYGQRCDRSDNSFIDVTINVTP